MEECCVIKEGETDLEEVKVLENGNFMVELPRTEAQCEIKFLRGHEEKIIIKNFDQKGKNKQDNNLTQQLKLMIESVNGYADKHVVDYFVDNMPVIDSRFLRSTYEKLNPNANLLTDFQCENCGHSEDMEVPLTIDFFWPKQ